MIRFYMLFVFFLADYVLTYIGINRSLITEANPLMVWMFDLPFLFGLAIRLVTGGLLIGILWLGRNTKAFKYGYKILITTNFAVLAMHLVWISALLF